MTANCCTSGQSISPNSAGQLHHSRSQTFCWSCNPSLPGPNEKLPFDSPEPQKTARDRTFGHTSSNLCVHEQIERSLAFARDDARGSCCLACENVRTPSIRAH